jgi:dGTPase
MSPAADPVARLHHEPAPRDRTEYERDRDRVLYSSAFARLAGITQVATTAPGHGFHNRLTHTLKVGQLSSRLAKVLSAHYEQLDEAAALDPDAAEAAALAHDLGHPPFGHLGEAVLCQLADAHACGGFEANAQSFRVVNRLARRSVQFEGLNLTRFTLDGMLKYPWLRGDDAQAGILTGSKWGAYDSELFSFNHARGLDPNAPATRSEAARSLTAQIIDWADDVTYAIHDLEDFYKAGVIPVHDLVWRPDEMQAFLATFFDGGEVRAKFSPFTGDQLAEAADSLRILFSISLTRPYDASLDLRALVRYVSSHLIGQYFNAVELVNDQQSGRAALRMDPALEAEVTVLKELLWFYVIDRPEFAALQHGQSRVLKDLFGMLFAVAETPAEWRLFPAPVRVAVEHAHAADAVAAAQARVVIDYIAGMTELHVVELYRALSGQSSETVLGR